MKKLIMFTLVCFSTIGFATCPVSPIPNSVDVEQTSFGNFHLKSSQHKFGTVHKSMTGKVFNYTNEQGQLMARAVLMTQERHLEGQYVVTPVQIFDCDGNNMGRIEQYISNNAKTYILLGANNKKIAQSSGTYPNSLLINKNEEAICVVGRNGFFIPGLLDGTVDIQDLAFSPSHIDQRIAVLFAALKMSNEN